MPAEKDLVIIRVWKGDDSDVFALFPELPADNAGNLCTSYQHIGQHSGADYHGCIGNSRPATAEEAAPLLEELRRIGYNPRVIRRANYRHHQTRRQWARVA
jgi:hypothetical protein